MLGCGHLVQGIQVAHLRDLRGVNILAFIGVSCGTHLTWLVRYDAGF